MDLLLEIKAVLDSLAGTVRQHSWTGLTGDVHLEMSKLAKKYAKSLGIGYGAVHDGCEGGETLIVHGKPAGSEIGFMLDHCWLIWYSSHTEPSEENTYGYLARCDLAMETEWHDIESIESENEALHRDFQKLVVVNAANKIFIFRSPSEADGQDTLRKMKNQVRWFKPRRTEERYLISFVHDNQFRHDEFHS